MSEPFHLHLPATWDTWRRLTEQDLEDGPDYFVGQSEMVWLPETLHRELDAKAQEAGWTYGQLIGYLAIQGLLRAAQPALEEPHA